MSSSGRPGAPALAARYAAALAEHVRDPCEASLRPAYELGREAMAQGIGVLALAAIHQDAVRALLDDTRGEEEVRRTARDADDFLLESLSSVEMGQRALGDIRESATRGRRQGELSRRLSTFLADASLVAAGEDPSLEMLQLVCEQARDLTGAACSVATVWAQPAAGRLQAASHPSDEPRWQSAVRWQDPSELDRLLRAAGGVARVTGDELARLSHLSHPDGDPPLRGWLGARLTTLDGNGIGAIQLFDKSGADFSADDEAVVVHLAQMVSASVERTWRYPGADG